jgi:hypothetical protein
LIFDDSDVLDDHQARSGCDQRDIEIVAAREAQQQGGLTRHKRENTETRAQSRDRCAQENLRGVERVHQLAAWFRNLDPR